jgi:TRAP-type C4-dicarboxylate transport system permease small subunit
MVDVTLQSIDLETLRIVRQASEAIIILFGLAISYIAYTAYRQNQSRPMLFIAVGFVLVLFVPGAMAVVLFLLLDVPAPVVNSVNQFFELAGLGLILYGLWVPRRD